MTHRTAESNDDEKALADRRAFLKRAAGIAVTAPAVALLLSAPSKAQLIGDLSPYGQPTCDNFDDTSGGDSTCIPHT